MSQLEFVSHEKKRPEKKGESQGPGDIHGRMKTVMEDEEESFKEGEKNTTRTKRTKK